jgi:hypothetical protein
MTRSAAALLLVAGMSSTGLVALAPPAHAAAPAPTLTSTTPDTGTDPTPDVAFTGAGTQYECGVTSHLGTVGTWQPCASPWTVPDLGADGEYDLAVREMSATDDGDEARVDYTLDTTADLTVTPPTVGGAPGNDPTPTWGISVEPGGSATCAFDGDPTPVPCTGGYTAATLTTNRSYDLVVTAKDALNNTHAPVTSTYVLDTVAPAGPVVTGSSGTDNDTQPSWSWLNPEGATALCTLTTPTGPLPEGTCPTGTSWTGTLTTNGSYQLAVVLRDVAGNRSTTETGPSYVLDTVPPTAPAFLSSPTPSPSSNASVTWTFTTPGATTTCTLVGVVHGSQGTAPCPAGTASYTLTSDDTWKLVVATDDGVGNIASTTSAGYVLDTTGPSAPTLTAPSGPGNTSVPHITWTGELPSTAQCRVERMVGAVPTPGPWVDCTARFFDPTLSVDGTYVFQAQLTDPLGNVGAIATSSPAYLYDGTAPTPPTLVTPSTPSSDASPTVTFTKEAGGTATCAVWSGTTAPASPAWTDCSSQTFTPTPDLPTDGTWTIAVRLTDAVGNTSAPTTFTYVLDTTGPAPVVISGVTSPGNDKKPTWNLTGDGASTLTCRVLNGFPGTTVLSTPSCTGGTAQADFTTDGTYTLEVTATDSAGNTTVTRQRYDLDTVAPSAPTVTAPAPSPGKAVSPAWTVGVPAGTTAECQLTKGVSSSPWTDCSSGSFVVPNITDGTYTLSARLTDLAGNLGPSTTSTAYTSDRTAPVAPTVSGPTGPGKNPSPTWTWTGEAGAQATCRLDKDGAVGSPVACNSGTFSPATAGDGSYVVVVVLSDAAGNSSAATTTSPYLLDTVVPADPVVAGPTGPSNTKVVTWSWSLPEAGLTSTCRLVRNGTAGAPATCTSGSAVTLPNDASYSLVETFTDAAGNSSNPVPSATYVYDGTAPAAPTVTTPSSPAKLAAPAFAYTAEAGATAECRLLRAATVVKDWTTCGSPLVDLTGLADGTYVLEVRVTDAAGNLSPTGTSLGYTYDTTAPTTPVVSFTPASPSTSTSPSVTWVGEAGTTASCRLMFNSVGQTPVACTQPWKPALTLGDGSYEMRVRLTDAAGNSSASGVSSTYVLDTTAPTAPVVVPEAPTGRSTVPSWSATYETGATTECKLTGPSNVFNWSPCTLPLVTDLGGRPDGTYTLSVRATDSVGLTGAVGSGTYLLDTTPPAAPVFTSTPPSPGKSRALTFAFTSEAGSTSYCKLTIGSTTVSADQVCTSPVGVSLASLADGGYTLTVHSVDVAGNSGPAQTATYVLDTTAPAAPVLTGGPAATAPDKTPTWSFTAEAGATVTCKVVATAGAFTQTTSPCTSPFQVTLPADDTYTFTATATDAAQNTGPALTRTYVLDSTAPATANVVGPRSPGKNTAPAWSVTSAEGTVQCQLLKGATLLRDWATCGPTFSVPLTAGDGTYTLNARVVDTAGNLSPVVSSTYLLDTAAPAAAVVVVPASPSTVRAPTFVISSSDTTATAQCQVVSPGGATSAFAPCPISAAGSNYNLDLSSSPDGAYTLVVRLTDAAGNTGPDGRGTYVLDTLPPNAVLVVAPASPSSVAVPSWLLTGDSDATLECRLSGPGFAAPTFSPCPTAAVAGTGTFTADLTAKADGTFTLTVRSKDAAGNLGAETSSSYELDRTAPVTPAPPSVPPSPAQNPSVTWVFAVEAGATPLCTLSSATAVISPEAPCTSPLTTVLPADGQYTLTLRAQDAAGNTSLPSSSSYVLDTLPPAVPTIITEPGSPGPEQLPKWNLQKSASADTLECQLVGLTGSTWAACSDPVTYDLAPALIGSYVLQVREVDAAGNVSEVVSSRTYVYDADAPITPDVSPPAVSPSNSTLPVFHVSKKAGDTDTVSLQCEVTRFDGKTSVANPCAFGDVLVDLSDVAPQSEGLVTLTAHGVDLAGNVGGGTTATYLYDSTPPTTPVIRPLKEVEGLSPKVSWSFGSAGTDTAGYVCTVAKKGTVVTSATATPCTGTKDVTLLTYGDWTLTVWGFDLAGNHSSPASSSYLYLPPVPTVTGIKAPAAGPDATPTWTFTVPRGGYTAGCLVSDAHGTTVATGDCTLGRFTPDLTGLAGGVYTLTVQLTDSHGNAGPYSARSAYRYVPASDQHIGQPGPTTPSTPGHTGGGSGGGSGGGTGAGTGGASGPTVTPVDPAPQHGSDNVGAPSQASGGTTRPTTGAKSGGTPALANTRTPGRLITKEATDAIGKTLAQAAQKPAIPLLLLGVVVGFLLLQNRIDRRDPKLASAPVGAEPELDFGPIQGLTPRTLGGGAPA